MACTAGIIGNGAVFELGPSSSPPWFGTTINANAKFIWNIPDARSNAPSNNFNLNFSFITYITIII